MLTIASVVTIQHYYSIACVPSAILLIPLTYFIIGSLYLLIPFPCFTHPATRLPYGHHPFVLCIDESVSVFHLFIWFFRFHIKVKSSYLSFSVQLISRSVISSRSISVVTYGKISFVLCLRFCCVYILLFIHSSMDVHLLCLCILAIINKTAVDQRNAYVFLN